MPKIAAWTVHLSGYRITVRTRSECDARRTTCKAVSLIKHPPGILRSRRTRLQLGPDFHSIYIQNPGCKARVLVGQLTQWWERPRQKPPPPLQNFALRMNAGRSRSAWD